ncbi:hypothetical protein EYZ11_004972 [Aspergillus tanneri]|uniref:feruloyl esterase n=1 Tax=Aspergillus tanneri TaxID=1220188 RepID=A0A4S3JLG5_9EURO|nr:hypothetical protein EYZ11_004972 [Aspergillus tanneri]
MFAFRWLTVLCAVTATAQPTKSAATILSSQLDEFSFWVQYAAAAYCHDNYAGTTGEKITCWADNCPAVEAAGATTQLQFSKYSSFCPPSIYEANENSATITDTAGFVAIDHQHQSFIVSFRGSYSVRSWLADISFPHIDPGLCDGCLAELGFWTSWAVVRQQVVSTLQALRAQNEGYRVVVVGHSLGAAIATLAAADLRTKGFDTTLYAYAAPRVANQELADFITKQGKNYRFTHTVDPVPKLPPLAMGYVHVSPEYWITTPDNTTVEPGEVQELAGTVNFQGNTGTGIPLLTQFSAHHWYFEQADASSTSSQWLIIGNTSIFWPTSTNYFYGPTDGPEASAVSCNAAWAEYGERSHGLWSLGPTATTTSTGFYPTSEGACRTSTSLEEWSDTHTGPVTTLCDGHPRGLGPRETATGYYPGTGPCITSTKTYSNVESVYRLPSPSPTCSLHTTDCAGIWETYLRRSSEYDSAHPTRSSGDTASPIRPTHCPRDYPEADPCGSCHFLPGEATLFYWPVQTMAGDLCRQDGVTVPATPTAPPGPNTAVVDGRTMVSPSVYLSFTSIGAWSNRRAHAGHQCGGAYENAVISVHPTAVSSMRDHRNAKYPRIGTAYPFNFAEFMPQTLAPQHTQSVIPWPQYRGGSQCPLAEDRTCTMVRDDYLPWLQMPEAVLQIDANWTNCDRSWYIPPVTLVPLPTPSSLTKAVERTKEPKETGAGETGEEDEKQGPGVL